MENKIPEAIKAKCKKCGYEWITLSPMFKVVCPSCLNKTQIREYVFVDEK